MTCSAFHDKNNYCDIIQNKILFFLFAFSDFLSSVHIDMDHTQSKGKQNIYQYKSFMFVFFCTKEKKLIQLVQVMKNLMIKYYNMRAYVRRT